MSAPYKSGTFAIDLRDVVIVDVELGKENLVFV